MLNKETRKQTNKNMLKASLLAGGFALFILTSFTLVTILGTYISNKNEEKNTGDYQNKKDAETFIEGLTYIANRQYQEKIGVSAVSNYVKNISAVQFTEEGVYYCAVAQKHDKESSLLLVNIPYKSDATFTSFIPALNKNYMNKEYFNPTSTLYTEDVNEEVRENMKNKIAETIPYFSDEKPYVLNVFEAKVMFAASLTYKVSDLEYRSIVIYEPLKNNCQPFNAVYEADKTTFYVLKNLVTNK